MLEMTEQNGAYVIYPHLEVVEQSDGTWVAMGRELPIFVAASSRTELDATLKQLEPAITNFVTSMGDGDALEYIKERGIPWRPDREAEAEYRIRIGA